MSTVIASLAQLGRASPCEVEVHRFKSCKMLGKLPFLLSTLGSLLKTKVVITMTIRVQGVLNLIKIVRHAPLAQLVEQAALNRRVVGSSPTGCTAQ